MVQTTATQTAQQRTHRRGVQADCFRCIVSSVRNKPSAHVLASRRPEQVVACLSPRPSHTLASATDRQHAVLAHCRATDWSQSEGRHESGSFLGPGDSVSTPLQAEKEHRKQDARGQSGRYDVEQSAAEQGQLEERGDLQQQQQQLKQQQKEQQQQEKVHNVEEEQEKEPQQYQQLKQQQKEQQQQQQQQETEHSVEGEKEQQQLKQQQQQEMVQNVAEEQETEQQQQLKQQQQQEKEQNVEEKEEAVGVRVALAVLKFYKREISPLLPPACRFLPTCSEYAMDSFKTFGVGKGSVLTVWRLMRCNPFGPSGYDPVRWPPPGLEWMIKS